MFLGKVWVAKNVEPTNPGSKKRQGVWNPEVENYTWRGFVTFYPKQTLPN